MNLDLRIASYAPYSAKCGLDIFKRSGELGGTSVVDVQVEPSGRVSVMPGSWPSGSFPHSWTRERILS